MIENMASIATLRSIVGVKSDSVANTRGDRKFVAQHGEMCPVCNPLTLKKLSWLPIVHRTHIRRTHTQLYVIWANHITRAR